MALPNSLFSGVAIYSDPKCINMCIPTYIDVHYYILSIPLFHIFSISDTLPKIHTHMHCTWDIDLIPSDLLLDLASYLLNFLLSCISLSKFPTPSAHKYTQDPVSWKITPSLVQSICHWPISPSSPCSSEGHGRHSANLEEHENELLFFPSLLALPSLLHPGLQSPWRPRLLPTHCFLSPSLASFILPIYSFYFTIQKNYFMYFILKFANNPHSLQEN